MYQVVGIYISYNRVQFLFTFRQTIITLETKSTINFIYEIYRYIFNYFT